MIERGYIREKPFSSIRSFEVISGNPLRDRSLGISMPSAVILHPIQDATCRIVLKNGSIITSRYESVRGIFFYKLDGSLSNESFGSSRGVQNIDKIIRAEKAILGQYLDSHGLYFLVNLLYPLRIALYRLSSLVS